ALPLDRSALIRVSATCGWGRPRSPRRARGVGMTGELRGRTALITGATQGLGLEIARQFLRAGIGGACICGRDAKVLTAASEQLRGEAEADQELLAEVADVSSKDDVDRLIAATLGRFPELTILVNNAGVYGPKGAIDDVSWTEWVRAIEINLYGSV